jgi:type I restriction enzyme S subunit
MSWKEITLREAAPSETAEISFSPDELVWHLNLEHIESNSGRILEKLMAPASDAGSSTHPFDEKNVLYSKLRPYLNKVVRPRASGLATSELVPLRPNPDLLDPDFLVYYLRSERFLTFSRAVVAGVKMPRMIMNKFWEHKVPLPPLSEQRRIVEILDQGDALSRKRAEADKIAERILPAMLQKMCGDSASRKSKTIQDLIDEGAILVHKDGNFGSDYPRENEFGPEGVPFLSASFLSENGIVRFDGLPRLNNEKAQRLRFGWVLNHDVLLAHNATVGRVGILEDATEPMLIGTSLTCFRANPEVLDPFYLYSIMASQEFQGQLKAIMGQATRNQVPITAQRKLTLNIVDLQRQRMLGEAVKDLRCTFRRSVQSKQELEKLLTVLLHRAFSGELTAKWRDAHMTELMQEMEEQTKYLQTDHRHVRIDGKKGTRI